MTAKVIDSGISAKHAPKWTVSEAVREIVQNWLDVKKEFGVTGTISWEDGMATIKDAGPGLQMRHLAFGENEKSTDAIGQFGEGLKSALVVLAREGRAVEIKTNGMIIHPVILKSANYETDTLHFQISDMTPRLAARLKGTLIRVECSRGELGEGQSYFVERLSRKSGGQLEWLDKGRISLPGGLIYVKGSAVGAISDARFSYHLDSNVSEIVNRDRNAVNMDVARRVIGKIIAHTSSTKVMDEVIDAQISGEGFEGNLDLEVYSHRAMKVWKRVWNRKFGTRTVLGSSHEYDKEVIYRNYDVIQASYRVKYFLQSFGVQDSVGLLSGLAGRSRKARIGKVSSRVLNTVEKTNLLWAKKMVRKYYADPGKVVVAEDLSGLLGADANGCYQPATKTTTLKREILTDRKQTLHTLLHETVHRVSGASDITAEFERALLDVAVNMIIK